MQPVEVETMQQVMQVYIHHSLIMIYSFDTRNYQLFFSNNSDGLMLLVDVFFTDSKIFISVTSFNFSYSILKLDIMISMYIY